MPSPSKVAEQTARQIRQSLRTASDRSLTYYASHPDEVEQRLAELDAEWSIERILETNSSASSLLGLALGYVRSSRWYLLRLAIHEFALQHALGDFCPAVPIFGRMGFRPRTEIAHEHRALETMRAAAQVRSAVTVDIKEFHVRPWAVRRISSTPMPPAAEVVAAA